MEPTNPSSLLQLEQLFADAKALPDAARGGFLAARCAGDSKLRREVEQLLALDAGRGTLLDAPAGAWLGRRFDR